MLDLTKTYRTRDGSVTGIHLESNGCGLVCKARKTISPFAWCLDGAYHRGKTDPHDLVAENEPAAEVDVTKIRPGDSVKVIVKEEWGEAGGGAWPYKAPLNDKGEVYIGGSWGGRHFKPEHVLAHTPKPTPEPAKPARPIAAGDYVFVPTGGGKRRKWRVLEVDEDTVILRDGKYAIASQPLTNVTLFEGTV